MWSTVLKLQFSLIFIIERDRPGGLVVMGDLMITRAQSWHDWQHQPIITSSVSKLQTQSNKHALYKVCLMSQPAYLSQFLEDVPLDEDDGLH